jgi:hypothetical protein
MYAKCGVSVCRHGRSPEKGWPFWLIGELSAILGGVLPKTVGHREIG